MSKHITMVETPYRGSGIEAIRYLAWALLDSYQRGECPVASHCIGPLALPETLEGRGLGLECRDRLAEVCDKVVCYVDTGVTEGMQRTPTAEHRTLSGELFARWSAGQWPTSARWTSTNETP